MVEKEKATEAANPHNVNAKIAISPDMDGDQFRKMLEDSAPLSLPLDGLPTKVQDIIRAKAEALNCPTEYITAAAMQAVSQAAGSRFYWDNGQYRNFPQFYTALVGDSTANKTSAIRTMLKPLVQADRSSVELWQLETAGMKPEERARHPYRINLVQDSTLEALQDTMKFNPDGVTAYNDEILSFFGNFDRYRGNGADEKFFLTAFANPEPFNKVRKGTLDHIPQMIVRIIGGIQPEVLRTYFRRSAMLSDGMLNRFLWYYVPDDFLFDEQGKPTDTALEDRRWSEIVSSIISKQDIVKVSFDEYAEKMYQDYKNGHARQKNSKTLTGYEASVCGKLEVYAVMWSMTIRILRYALEGCPPWSEIYINDREMEYTLRCMDYFRRTAMKVFETITDDTASSMTWAEWTRIGYLRGFYENQSAFGEVCGKDRQKVNDAIKGRRK